MSRDFIQRNQLAKSGSLKPWSGNKMGASIKDVDANMNRTHSVLDFKDNPNQKPLINFAGLNKNHLSDASNQ